jgi:SAM-dependent methyltransferase
LKLSRYLRVLAITCFCKKTGKMIDVGFSRGTTMKMLEARGWEVFGTQISPIAYKNARKKGLNVFLGEIKYAGIAPKSRDLVTFWHVLEHVKDPGEYIKETNRLLKDSGKLIIEIPNIASPIAKIFGKKWFGLDLPRHIYHFSPESLKHILIDNGFCIVKERYFSLDQSIFSLLQCILNLFNHRNNVLFSSIKKNAKIGFFPAFYNWLLAAIFLVPSLLIAPLMGFLRCGDIMRVYCIKVNDSN